MNKVLKVFLSLIAICLVLLLLAVILIPLLINPNDFKPEIEAAIEQRSGRHLVIEGNLELSVFPWLGFTTGRLTLSNAKGFKGNYFAEIEATDIKVKLLPLLSQQLEVKQLTFKGLQLNLAKNAQGQNNWDDFSSETSTDEKNPLLPLAALAIGGIHLENAKVHWFDEISNQQLTIEQLELTIERFKFNQAVALQLKGLFQANQPQLETSVELTGDLQLNESFEQISFKKLLLTLEGNAALLSFVAKLNADVDFQPKTQQLKLTELSFHSELSGENIPTERLILDSKMTVALNLAEQQLQLNALQLHAGFVDKKFINQIFDININTNAAIDLKQKTVELKKIDLIAEQLQAVVSLNGNYATQQFTGQLQLAEFNPRQLLAQLAIAVPPFKNAQVINKASAKLTFNFAPQQLQLSALEIEIDESRLTGSLAVNDFKQPKTNFNLAIDKLNIDDYGLEKTPSKKIAPAKAVAKTPARVIAAISTQTELFPLESLQQLNSRGRLKIGQLIANQLTMKNVTLELQAKEGDIQSRQTIQQFYQGSYSGHLNINAKKKPVEFNFSETLKNVQLEPLVHDNKDKIKIHGSATITAKLTAKGSTEQAIKSSLNGTIKARINNGVLLGFNLDSLISQSKSLLKGKIRFDPKQVNQMKFTQMSGSAVIRKGIATNKDLMIKAPSLDAHGHGTINLNNDTLNYHTTANLIDSKAKEGQNNLKQHKLIVHTKGSLENPQHSLDISQLISEEKKQKILDKVEKKLGSKASEFLKKWLH